MDVKRLMIISHSSGLYGAERSLVTLVMELDKCKVEPIVIVPNKGPLYELLKKKKIKTYVIKFTPFIGSRLKSFFSILCEPKVLFNLKKIIEIENIDLIYTNTITVFSGGLISLIVKKPHVWHLREIINNESELKTFLPQKCLYKLVGRLSTLIVTNSYFTASPFNLIGQYKEKLRIIYNGIDINQFDSNQKLIESDQNLYSNDWPIVLIGSISKAKGQEEAIRILKLLIEEIPNAKLLIIGNGKKRITDYLKKLCRDLNIEDKVVFCGVRKDVPQVLNTCKIVLNLATNEGFGRVTVEAMAAGVPVVAAKAGATTEIIQNGVNGFLVRPKDLAGYAQIITELYNNKQLYDNISFAGRRKVEEKFYLQRYVKEIENLFITI